MQPSSKDEGHSSEVSGSTTQASESEICKQVQELTELVLNQQKVISKLGQTMHRPQSFHTSCDFALASQEEFLRDVPAIESGPRLAKPRVVHRPSTVVTGCLELAFARALNF